MTRLTAIPEAQAELDRAYAYYFFHASERTAAEFLDEVVDAFDKIAGNPEQWPAEEGTDYRFFTLKRHSYVIYYRVETPQTVRVVAVPHSSQRPGYWHGR
jgi:plasmid stabilization system protein ParE